MDQNALPQVAGVICDTTGVLYDGTVWLRWLFQLLSRMGMYSHFAAFARLWEEDYLPQSNIGGKDYWQTLGSYLGELGFSQGQIDEILAAGTTRRREFELNARPLPHVRSTLERLERGRVRLGVCCAGPWTRQQVTQRIEGLGISHCFTVVESRHNEAGSRDLVAALRETVAALGLSATQVAVVSSRVDLLLAAVEVGAVALALDPPVPIEGAMCLERFEDVDRLAIADSACTLAG